MPAAITIDQEAVARFCRRRHITELALFGSVLRDDFSSESDVDVLVSFAAGHTPGFVELHHMEQELSKLLGGRRLDLVTQKFLNHRIRDAVLADAEVVYAEG
jgi:predicted nucleotidyltransferase